MTRPNTRPFTRQQWITMCVIGCVHFASAICISLQAPFYPQEAESKGGTATEYGLVFGVFELTAFLTCPIFGKYLHKIGAKLTLNLGVFVAAICSILFGLLDYATTHLGFIGLSFAVRIIESLGASAALTAAFSITAAVFPDSIATTFATLEIFYGVGYIAGPTIGGFLFVAGGYVLPFITMGSILLFVSVIIFFALPSSIGNTSTEIERNQPYTGKKRKTGVFSMLSIPAVLVDALCIMAASSSMGFYAATLEPNLRQFQLTPIVMCTIFVLSGATYAVTAPFVGRLCDKYVSPRILTLGGCWLVLIGCLLVGPAPFTDLKPSLGLCITGLVIHGFGLALLLVSCFIDALRSTIASGFVDGLATYGLVSGMWASSFSLGAFVGPSMAGLLFDLVGFRKATYFIIGTQVIVFFIVLVFICVGDNELEQTIQMMKRPVDEIHGLGEEDVVLLSSSKSSRRDSWQPHDYGATNGAARVNNLDACTSYTQISVCS